MDEQSCVQTARLLPEEETAVAAASQTLIESLVDCTHLCVDLQTYRSHLMNALHTGVGVGGSRIEKLCITSLAAELGAVLEMLMAC